MHKQKLITGILVLIIIGMLTIVVLGSKNKDKNIIQKDNNQEITEEVVTNDKTPIFFYGNTCPHCKDVEDWMAENKIEEKILLIKKEVYDNRQNALELEKVAKNCGISADSIGVPFLYAEGKCITGTPEITSYLSEISEITNVVDSEEESEL
jgi:glutaredoxin